MPLYEYQCDACGHRFEVIQKFSDPLVDTLSDVRRAPCTSCMSSPAIQFKGTGWYITDYAKKGQGTARVDGGRHGARVGRQDGKSRRQRVETPRASQPTTRQAPTGSSSSESEPDVQRRRPRFALTAERPASERSPSD